MRIEVKRVERRIHYRLLCVCFRSGFWYMALIAYRGFSFIILDAAISKWGITHTSPVPTLFQLCEQAKNNTHTQKRQNNNNNSKWALNTMRRWKTKRPTTIQRNIWKSTRLHNRQKCSYWVNGSTHATHHTVLARCVDIRKGAHKRDKRLMGIGMWFLACASNTIERSKRSAADFIWSQKQYHLGLDFSIVFVCVFVCTLKYKDTQIPISIRVRIGWICFDFMRVKSSSIRVSDMKWCEL